MSTALLGAPTAASAQSGPEQTLQDMREAFRKKDSRALSAALPRLQGHLLEPLGAYWELRVRLESASPDEIRAFMSRWAGSYYEDRLRNDWLLLLGQRARLGQLSAQALPIPHERRPRGPVLCACWPPQGPRPGGRSGPLWLAQKEAGSRLCQRRAPLLQTGARWPHGAGNVPGWDGEQPPRASTQAVSMVDMACVATV